MMTNPHEPEQNHEQGPRPGAAPVATVESEPVAHSFGSRVRTYFLTGLVVGGPVLITIYLTWSFVTWVDGLVQPFIPVAYRPETYLPVKIRGSG
jgi:hypothetical protein